MSIKKIPPIEQVLSHHFPPHPVKKCPSKFFVFLIFFSREQKKGYHGG
jgi:hypothetical protein